MVTIREINEMSIASAGSHQLTVSTYEDVHILTAPKM